MSIAIYPGTFDPITNGHLALIKRVANVFDKIVIGVAASNAKGALLTYQQRIELTQQVLQDFNNVEVHGFDGLTVAFAKHHNAKIIIRGLRTEDDFSYEYQLANMNHALCDEIETLFIAPAEHNFISSSIVREIAAMGGDISQFVPMVVLEALSK